jgi:drug/metabolite transporter (DMT)-like permease
MSVTHRPPATALLARCRRCSSSLIWSTGFVVARYGMPHAPPMGFLALRYALSVLAFAVWIAIAARLAARPRAVGAPGGQWRADACRLPGRRLGGGQVGHRCRHGGADRGHAAGAHGAMAVGRGAGHARHAPPMARPAAGPGGLVLVVWHKLGAGRGHRPQPALGVLALLSITVGTLYQKRHMQPCDVRTANAVQLAAAFAVTAPLAWLEAGAWQMASRAGRRHGLVGAGADAGRQLAAVSADPARRGGHPVTSLLYMVPPCTAVLAWLLFGEPLSAQVLAGVALTAGGVALVVRAG